MMARAFGSFQTATFGGWLPCVSTAISTCPRSSNRPVLPDRRQWRQPAALPVRRISCGSATPLSPTAPGPKQTAPPTGWVERGRLALDQVNRSTERRSVQDAALRPELVDAPRQLQRRVRTNIAVEGLAVIADALDDVIGELLVEPELLAEIRLLAEHPKHFRIGRAGHLVDIRLGDAKLFGDDHGVQRPADDIAELVVAMTGHRAERLLGDDLRQDHVGIRIGQLDALGGEAGLVGGVDVATAGVIGRDDQDRLEPRLQ
eukprot:TRINITY_DN6151_c0_g1_i2.p2 TRINITY_DN6151_c0_g1~~TRINITY_DN6151_c0_g1_i2.p2  ORF type:complete len:260 (+),score=23.37 TRINITY_DN6151_c0_g1_i2:269-1048(+)